MMFEQVRINSEGDEKAAQGKKETTSVRRLEEECVDEQEDDSEEEEVKSTRHVRLVKGMEIREEEEKLKEWNEEESVETRRVEERKD